jgi:uncharacterized protein involved in exopolysaccharide biosynthesis
VLLRRTGANVLATSWTPFYGLEEEMNTEVEIAVSDPVLVRAIEILNERNATVTEVVKKHRTTRPPVVEDLGVGVSAEPIEMSNIILIKCRGADPKFVREAANAIAQAYVEYRGVIRETRGVDEYFEEQINKLNNQLIDLSKTELELRRKAGVYDREWQQRMIMNRETEIALKVNQTRGRRTSEEAKLVIMKQRIKDDPNVVWPFAVTDDDHLAVQMLTEYWNLLRERDNIASSYTPTNPQVKMLEDRVARMEERLREEAQRRIKDKEYLLEDLKADEAAFQGELRRISDEYIQDPDVIARIEHLGQEIHYTYLHYDRLLEKMLDTMASEAEDIRMSNAKVLSPADVKMTKAGQMKSVYVIFSILLGVTLGIGFGFLMENLDHSIKSASDVEDLVGVQLLGSIPEAGHVSEIRNRGNSEFGNGT